MNNGLFTCRINSAELRMKIQGMDDRLKQIEDNPQIKKLLDGK